MLPECLLKQHKCHNRGKKRKQRKERGLCACTASMTVKLNGFCLYFWLPFHDVTLTTLNDKGLN